MASSVAPRRWQCPAMTVKALTSVDQYIGANARTLHLAAETYAIAIAPDSDVDVVELQPDGNASGDNRIMVSARRPWVGRLPPGAMLRVVPRRRAWLSSGALLPDEYGDNFFGPLHDLSMAPRLILEIYGRPDITSIANLPALPLTRAPLSYNWSERTVAAAATKNFACPVMGRNKFVVAMTYSTAGAPTIAGTIYGIDSLPGPTVYEAFTTLTTFTKTSIDSAGGQLVYQYEGPPFDYVQVAVAVTTADITWSQSVHQHEDF